MVKLIKEIESYLIKTFKLDQERLNHTHHVKDMALKLGEIHSVDLYKLEVASLLHDFTKKESVDESFEVAKSKFSEEILKEVPAGCLHAYSATVKAENMFSIHDQEILDAITYHCSGRIFKSKVEQIVFISDYIEETRVFVEESLRVMAIKDLDLVTYHILNDTVNYMKEKNRKVASLTKEAFRYYKNKLEEVNEH